MTSLIIPTIIGVIAYILLYFMKWRHYQSALLPDAHKAEISTYASKVTIVIPPSNQAQELEQLITRLLEQTYTGGLEIVVVCYSTTDNTLDILKKLEYDHRNIRHIIVPASAHFIDIRKLAITIGVKSVRTEWFALITPDFFPETNDWLASLTKHIKGNYDLILGYENFRVCEHTIYPLQYATHQGFIQSSYIHSSIPPCTCNFIIRKKAFELTRLYDDVSLQYNLGSISKLISPLYAKKSKYFCSHPDSIGRLHIQSHEAYALKKDKEAEAKILYKFEIKNTILKLLQSTLIYIYGVMLLINGALFAMCLATTFNIIHTPSEFYINTNIFSDVNSILISGISMILQMVALAYPILILKKNLRHFKVDIPTFYLLILPITLPINGLFYKIKSLFSKNKYRRTL